MLVTEPRQKEIYTRKDVKDQIDEREENKIEMKGTEMDSGKCFKS